jgi:hypothetical protein
MCQQCSAISKEVFPDATADEIGFILINLTPWPFIHGDELRKALLHIKEIGTDAAIREAEDAIRLAMSKLSGDSGG